jgi:hypothetical protein
LLRDLSARTDAKTPKIEGFWGFSRLLTGRPGLAHRASGVSSPGESAQLKMAEDPAHEFVGMLADVVDHHRNG